MIGYVLLYHLIFPGIDAATSLTMEPSLLVPRFLAECLYTFLVLLPFIFYRSSYGWLHPMMFPFLLSLLKTFFKQPMHLIAPFKLPIASFDPTTYSYAIVLRYLPLEDLAMERLQMTLLLSFFLVIYYLAFFFYRPAVPKQHFATPHLGRLWIVCAAAMSISILTAVIFILMNGGLTKHLQLLTGGRYEALGGSGQYIEIVGAGVIALMLLAAYNKRIWTNLFFLGFGTLLFVFSILVSGSRSSGVYLIMMMGMVFMFQQRTIPWRFVIIGAMVGFIVFGAFGMLRKQHNSRDLDWSVVTSLDVESWVDAAADESLKRLNEESSFAAFVGTGQYGLLGGKTYIAALFFWVPRALWHDKPRGAGAYNNYQNFSGRTLDTDEIPTVGGRPVGAEVEAYWNFWIFGVVVLALFVGMLHKWLATLILIYPREPLYWVLYITIITSFSGTALSIVGTARSLAVLAVLVVLAGIVQFRQRHVASRSRRGVAFSDEATG
ncbi:MAG: hypothetical protein GC184_03860 [Rhizobiales bacterium]|nr:hypothetical protein [Hyphomicrobiales bacterium]